MEDFLLNFSGDKEKVKSSIEKSIKYLRSVGREIDELFIKSLLGMIESNKCIETMKVYEYFESIAENDSLLLFVKFKDKKASLIKDINYSSKNKVVIEEIERSEFILCSRNKYNDMVFAFLLDCLNRRYKITKDMISEVFKDSLLNWEMVSKNLASTNNEKLDKYLRITKWEPERLAYSTCGKLLILSK